MEKEISAAQAQRHSRVLQKRWKGRGSRMGTRKDERERERIEKRERISWCKLKKVERKNRFL